jgi:hypothetical protein
MYDLSKAGISWPLRSHFGSMTAALKAAGLNPRGRGYRPGLAEIMLDWAALTRKLGRTPTRSEYRHGGKFSATPFIGRFGRWTEVPAKFVDFVLQHGIEKQWEDVLQVASPPPESKQSRRLRRQAERSGSKLRPVMLKWDGPKGLPKLELLPNSGRAVYGAPLPMQGMIHEPTNEDGVICLFGMLAAKLGLLIRRVQSEFPDCEVLYEVEPGRWICLLLEFEFESRNFAKHRHRAEGCDMIVCWIHNWSNCPEKLQVLELSRVVKEV